MNEIHISNILKSQILKNPRNIHQNHIPKIPSQNHQVQFQKVFQPGLYPQEVKQLQRHADTALHLAMEYRTAMEVLLPEAGAGALPCGALGPGLDGWEVSGND